MQFGDASYRAPATQRVPFNDVRLNRDGGPFELIEQRAGRPVVGLIGRSEREAECRVSLLPRLQSPIAVHGVHRTTWTWIPIRLFTQLYAFSRLYIGPPCSP